MRVLHVITSLADGGAEAVLHRLVSHDPCNVHHVVSLTTLGKYGERLLDAGIPVEALNIRRGRLPVAALLRLARKVAQYNPDVVQTWMYHADLLGGLASRLAGQRVIVWGVRNGSLDPRSTSLSTRSVARLCAQLSGLIPQRIVSCSRSATEHHVRSGYRRNRIVTVPNGVDVRGFAPDAEASATVRMEWGIPQGVPLMGMVARWHPAKDHRTLLDALAALVRRGGPAWHCALVGDGMVHTNTPLVEWLDQSGLSAKVSLRGASLDIARIMNGLDVHVLASISEGFPNVLPEAMACGTPCVVTDVGDCALIVGDTGWVVPPSSPGTMAEALHSALIAMTDRAAWERRQAAARQRVLNEWSLQRMVRSYTEVWQDALGDGLRNRLGPVRRSVHRLGGGS